MDERERIKERIMMEMNPGAGADAAVEELADIDVTEPNLWRVVMLNDDKTTMDFVVGLLVLVFHKQPEEAVEIMLTIHATGSAVVGVYTHEIAEEKMNTCLHAAKAEGFPLQVIIEEDT
jgi:ATP-dependent Clp protease adaptor protein ClpS